MRKLAILLVLIFAIPLMGLRGSDDEPFGCSCEAAPEESIETEVPGGGGVAESVSYKLSRSQIGPSWEGQASLKENYRVSATLGHYIVRGRILSDAYLIHHPMSRDLFLKKSDEIAP